MFKASHSRFANFKQRTGAHNVVRHGEGTSSDKIAAYEFVKHLWKGRILFANKFSVVMKLGYSGRKCRTGPISHNKRSHCQDTSQ